MDLHEALYTTRAMRRLRPDPIPDEVVARIVDAAIRAPSGGNQQRFRFLVVTDRDTVAAVAPLYRHSLDELFRTGYGALADREASGAGDAGTRQAGRVLTSARSLAEHFEAVPLLLFAFGAPGGESSVFPAVWSACLAARAEGVGSTVTTVLNRYHRAEVEARLGKPSGAEWEMMAMVPMGYPLGRWGIAKRRPAHELTYSERWGRAPGWVAPGPLWAPPA